LLVLPGLAWNHNPPNLSLQVARIIRMIHQCLAFFFFFWLF
jgi:hypothetical protein